MICPVRNRQQNDRTDTSYSSYINHSIQQLLLQLIILPARLWWKVSRTSCGIDYELYKRRNDTLPAVLGEIKWTTVPTQSQLFANNSHACKICVVSRCWSSRTYCLLPWAFWHGNTPSCKHSAQLRPHCGTLHSTNSTPLCPSNTPTAQRSGSSQYVDLVLKLSLLTKGTSMIIFTKNQAFYVRLGPRVWESYLWVMMGRGGKMTGFLRGLSSVCQFDVTLDLLEVCSTRVVRVRGNSKISRSFNICKSGTFASISETKWSRVIFMHQYWLFLIWDAHFPHKFSSNLNFADLPKVQVFKVLLINTGHSSLNIDDISVYCSWMVSRRMYQASGEWGNPSLSTNGKWAFEFVWYHFLTINIVLLHCIFID